jgi:hypothetical protein
MPVCIKLQDLISVYTDLELLYCRFCKPCSSPSGSKRCSRTTRGRRVMGEPKSLGLYFEKDRTVRTLLFYLYLDKY